MGIAALVIGIVSLILGFVPLCNYFALIPAFVGLVLGIIDTVLKKKKGQPLALSIVGAALNAAAIIVIIVWTIVLAAVGNSSGVKQFQDELNKATKDSLQIQQELEKAAKDIENKDK